MSDRAIIEITDDGPLYVSGAFTLTRPSGLVVQVDGETWLCRCGASNDKPFCDGSHNRIGFSDHEARADEGEGFVEVCDLADIPVGELKEVTVAGQVICLAHVDAYGGSQPQIYAIGGICTHANARLAEGVLEGEHVTCPLHQAGFNVITGKATNLPAETPVPTYAVMIEGGKVLVSRRPMHGETAA
ncbi:MAG: CDGSH iron-sulfur domain-containing protein [Dehalococcoidia bacterium]|nr:CDGSH iron-sulfur domain-containing protein [Dehalococcoidia bacterium]